jgi:hypothetical protein
MESPRIGTRCQLDQIVEYGRCAAAFLGNSHNSIFRFDEAQLGHKVGIVEKIVEGFGKIGMGEDGVVQKRVGQFADHG